MADHTIRLGNLEIPLVKARQNFRVVRPSRNALRQIRQLRGLRGLHHEGSDIWRVSVGDRAALDEAMATVRTEAVAHHVYMVADSDLPVPFIPNDRVYLRPHPEMTDAELRSLAEQLGLVHLRTRDDGMAVFRVTTETGMNPIKVCERLLNDARLDVVEPDYFMNIRRASVGFDQQWHLHSVAEDGRVATDSHIDVERAWAVTRGNPDIVVAIMDDGFDLTNPDLQRNVIGPADFTFAGNSADVDAEIVPFDDDPSSDAAQGDYHGTPCAGLAIARRTAAVSGVAPGCSWMPIRVTIGFTSQEDTLRIFEYVSRRADVLSCSWGVTPTSYQVPSEAQRSLFERLRVSGGRRGKGLPICFAAGNENLPTSIDAADNPRGFEYYDPSGARLGTFFRNKAVHSSWTELPGVITVGAVSARNRKAIYSNWGRDVWVVAPSNNFNPAAAPDNRHGAVGLVTTDNDRFGRGLFDIGLAEKELGFVTDAMGGTSGATPQVAGLCALMLSANEALTATEVREIIANSAIRIGLATSLEEPVPMNNRDQSGAFDANGRSLWYGHGRINAGAAVDAVRR